MSFVHKNSNNLIQLKYTEIIQNETDTQFSKRDKLQFKIYLTEHILEYHDN